MKKTMLVAALLLSSPALAETIPAPDAPAFVGQSATVVGRASIQRMASGEIYLDLDGRSDGAPISAYVSRWNAARFSGLDALDGKLVAVSGAIGSFRYRPEIFLTDPGQIAPVEPAATAETPPQPRWIHIGKR
ncbi:MAG TPA: hypothetical protein VFI23_07885 [Rhizomicrobium sp.]|nr:hypothetical protein [Rhizomicrobium sp.]